MQPGPNIAVRVEFIARHQPSQAGNETSEDYETHFVRLLFIMPLYLTDTVLYVSMCYLKRASVGDASVWSVVALGHLLGECGPTRITLSRAPAVAWLMCNCKYGVYGLRFANN